MLHHGILHQNLDRQILLHCLAADFAETSEDCPRKISAGKSDSVLKTKQECCRNRDMIVLSVGITQALNNLDPQMVSILRPKVETSELVRVLKILQSALICNIVEGRCIGGPCPKNPITHYADSIADMSRTGKRDLGQCRWPELSRAHCSATCLNALGREIGMTGFCSHDLRHAWWVGVPAIKIQGMGKGGTWPINLPYLGLTNVWKLHKNRK